MFLEIIVNAINIISMLGWTVFIIFGLFTFFRLLFRYGPRKALRFLLSLPVLITVVLLIAFSGLSFAVRYVPPENVAVVPSLLSPRGIRPQAMRPGFHLIFPFIESTIEYPAYWQTYTMASATEDADTADDTSIRARTSDGQEVLIDCSVIFRIDPVQAVLVHVDWQNRYRDDFVRTVVRGQIRTQISQFTAEEVNSSARLELEDLLNELLREELRRKGFILDQLVIRNVSFSTEFASAIERKQVALEDQIASQYLAQRQRLLAGGRADALLIEARARAQALKVIGEALATNPELLSYYYIERLAPNIQVMLLPADQQFILPIPQLTAMSSVSATNPLTPTVPLTNLNMLNETIPLPAVPEFGDAPSSEP
ncbi:MAG: prohibitin family protein [Chloroflexia bacterium]|nr:prohibitin family protein [Chloroflexia bacterium]